MSVLSRTRMLLKARASKAERIVSNMRYFLTTLYNELMMLLFVDFIAPWQCGCTI